MNFLETFVRYLRTRTDAPPDYHLHAGMCALSVALGTGIYADGRSRHVYPNLWCVIIGGSGFGKSVPLDFCVDLVRKAGLGEHILADSFSGEALYDEFNREPVRLAVFQEFGGFMGALEREYMRGAIQWLTSLYDVPSEDRRVLRGEKITLRLPFLTILGASTPEWFSDSFKQNALRGGFLARFVFCPSEARGAYVAHPGPRNEGLEITLADHLRVAHNLAGRIDFSRVVRRFDEWDQGVREELRTGQVAPEFGGLRSRSGVLAQKAAILMHVAADPESLTITSRDLDQAIAYVERAYELATRYLSESVAIDRDDADTQRILEIITRLGGEGVSRSVVLRQSHFSVARLSRAEATLVESGRLNVRTGGAKGARVYDLPGSNVVSIRSQMAANTSRTDANGWAVPVP